LADRLHTELIDRLMAPRTILYTGKGGVGKTSVAAATARRCAQAGKRTIVLSTDPAHSLSDALDVGLGPDPTPVGPRLWGQEVQAQEQLERNWSAVQSWLGELLVERGVDRISAEELTVPPGLDELFSLLVLRSHHESGDYEVVVVDCAPTGETLRLLSFPDVARWWLEKVFPQRNQILAAARPFARAVLDVSLPDESVLEDFRRLVSNLIAMHEILRDRRHVTIRLVMNPDRMVIDEARRTFTYLNLYGYLTDAVVVNRVFPEEVGHYFNTWRERQQEHLRTVESAFAPVPVLMAPYFDSEVVGAEMLDRLGEEVFADRPPHAVLHDRLVHELKVGRGQATLRLELPFATKGDISLKKIGLELVVRVDGHKRTIVLPPALAGYRPGAASFEDGALEVKFEPQDDGVARDAVPASSAKANEPGDE
jgi:arsenite-transporting ATPase